MISLAGKVTTGLVESNGSLSTGFMTNVTCGLTAKKPGLAPCSTLVNEYGTTLLDVVSRALMCIKQSLLKYKLHLRICPIYYWSDLLTETLVETVACTEAVVNVLASDTLRLADTDTHTDRQREREIDRAANDTAVSHVISFVPNLAETTHRQTSSKLSFISWLHYADFMSSLLQKNSRFIS